jgi:hypothetical protein
MSGTEKLKRPQMPIEDDIGKKELGGFDRLLLAPGYFVFEIFAVLVPGALFSALLVLKGEYHAQIMLNSVAFGYKTKIALGLMFSYVIGKVLETPGIIIERLATDHYMKKSKDTSQTKVQNETKKKFLAGVFFLPGLFSKAHALDYVVLARAQHFFSMDCGTALLVASVFSGDNNLRILELVVGVFFLLRGYYGVKDLPDLMMTMMGLSMTTGLEKLFPNGLVSALPALAQLMRDAPKPPVTPEAAPATAPNASAPAPSEVAKRADGTP